MWNSVELFTAYVDSGGDKLSRRTLVQRLQDMFGDDLLVLSSPGRANIVAFRSFASKTLSLLNDEEDETETVATKASKLIRNEVKDIHIDRDHYDITVSKDLVKVCQQFFATVIRQTLP